MSAFDTLFQLSIGRWFIEDTAAIPVPSKNLGVSLTASSAWSFKAPVSGLASVAVIPSGTPPFELASFRDGVGNFPFPAGSFVVTLRLLPAIEERLTTLTTNLKRSAARTLAIVLAAPPPIDEVSNVLLTDIDPFPPTSTKPQGATKAMLDKLRASFYGLGLDKDGKTLIPGDKPIQTLRKTGEILLRVKTGTGATLWAFDRDGHAIDPGAVAAWWDEIAKSQNLTVPNESQTCAPSRTVHLVHPNDAPLTSPKLLGRLSFTGISNPNLTECVQTASTTNPVVNVANPVNEPRLRVSVFPTDTYGTNANVVFSTNRTRDFVRVGVVDLEHLLVGLDADVPLTATDPQSNAATRVDIAPDGVGDNVLRVNADDALDGLIEVFNRPTSSTDIAWAMAPAAVPGADDLALEAPATAALPNSVNIKVYAVVGASGEVNGERIRGQRALVEVNGCAAGSWVRVFPHRVDMATGLRQRMLGGGGRVCATDNLARALVTLPDGSLSSGNELSCDVLVVTLAADGSYQSRWYVDLRFPRPAPVTGAAITTLSNGAIWCVCEKGLKGLYPAAIPVVPAGASLVVLPSTTLGAATWMIVPTNALSKTSVGAEMLNNDKLALCTPAYTTGVGRISADGRPATGAPVANGFTCQVEIAPRYSSADTSARPIAPTGVERNEVAVIRARADAHTVDDAAIGSVPLLAPLHEVGGVQFGAPGICASEVHGTGARLKDQAARLIAEHVRNRIFSSKDLAAHALTPWSSTTATTPAGVWVAALRAGAITLDVEASLASDLSTKVDDLLKAMAIANNATNIDAAVNAILAKLGLPSATIADKPLQLASFARALAMRTQWAKNGAREAERSMAGAVARAERFVYIETPAIHPNSLVVTALKKRLVDRPGLLVLIAASAAPRIGLPTVLAEAERFITRKTVTDLVSANPRRVVAFAPSAAGGRAVRMYSTTLIVDDIFAYTGTSHLSRRGSTFDGSIGIAVFDERLDAGRPKEIRRFRRALVAERLGLSSDLLPEDPLDLLVHIAEEQARGGERVARVPPPATNEITDADLLRYDPTGAGPLDSAGITQLFNTILGIQQDQTEKEAVAERDEIVLSS